ncbi:fructan beta-fructosidase [Parabacteroides sp. PFB2-12]|uniref:glycoside hydrolase family 32 protein n=1 Tax=unclassified Parabacteroides TaxID=2649774 RepID=UPI0024767B69|nr:MULTISPECIES: glycoside hydrolase family 32 protein [unclassified Parabacteroides]MDH6343111.1 fructan beta-fructosidase [Parabacteroides sp. PM6-13]MDH6390755.1 fructan beta-fructosidase [Parabacteroides sp. PFB2-12]
MKHLTLVIIGCCLLAACNSQKGEQNESKENLAFQESYRPQIHFSPASGWMNDPNGMVYYEGEYHLYYQHYPEDTKWGPMHWGHAISSDLVHWEHQPIAIYPDEMGYIFSGSAVVDTNNSSGLGTIENPPLIAFFTYHDMAKEKAGEIDIESQAIAYSLDKGRTWTKYAKNPVVKNPGIRDFRDPKVIWHEASKQWIMSVASGQVIRFYSSTDCLAWHELSEFGSGKGNHDGVWECPDLFPLKVSNSDEEKWVLIVNINPGGPAGGSASQYFVGDFDGKQFVSDQKETLWMDYGKDNYAGVTWSDAPDNRRILIGWMNNWQYAGHEPTTVWSGAATFPREMGLVKDGSIYLLTSTPVKELDRLREKTVDIQPTTINKTLLLSDLITFETAPLEINLRFNQENNTQMNFATKYGIRLKNEKGEYIAIGYDNLNKVFYVDRTNATGETFSPSFASLHGAPYIINSPQVDWQLLVDVSSVEFFAAGNRIVLTNTFYPSEPFNTVELFTQDGVIGLTKGSITQLSSIWKQDVSSDKAK